MSDRQQLTACGFHIADVPFRGSHGRLMYFATRLDPESNLKHWFCIDFARSTVDRWSKHGAKPMRWTIAEACAEFDVSGNPGADLGFVDRLGLIGFRLQKSSTWSERIPNYFGSLGDGSKWLICARPQKLIRFDVKPWEDWQLSGLRMVPVQATRPVAPLSGPDSPTLPKGELRAACSVSRKISGPIEHSGRNTQEVLF